MKRITVSSVLGVGLLVSAAALFRNAGSLGQVLVGVVVLVLGTCFVAYCVTVGRRDERRGEAALRRGGYVFLGLSLAAVAASIWIDGETFSDAAKFAVEMAFPWSVILWYRSRRTESHDHDPA